VRQLQVLVDDETRDDVTAVLGDAGVDYIRQEAWADSDRAWPLSVPVPDDAVGYFIDRLSEVGVDRDQYTLIGSLDSAMTPTGERLRNRFASDFDREIGDEVDALAAAPEYRSLDPVTIRTEYTGELLFPQPDTVTVRSAHSGSGQPPDVVEPLGSRIRNATGERVTGRTVYTEYNSSTVAAPNGTAPNGTTTTANGSTTVGPTESTTTAPNGPPMSGFLGASLSIS